MSSSGIRISLLLAVALAGCGSTSGAYTLTTGERASFQDLPRGTTVTCKNGLQKRLGHGRSQSARAF